MTKIEWTDTTWNPVTGCTKVSPGCDYCYAEAFARRFAGTPAFPRAFEVQLHPERLDSPLRWRKPRRVFVNSMSDLFHDAVPDLFIHEVFDRMGAAPQHTFQILTKRHGRMRSLLRRWERCATEGCRCPDDLPSCSMPIDVRHGAWPLPNVWLGVSVEDQQRANLRIPALLDTPAAVRFLSCEPLLGSVDLNRWLRELHWVIVGGESGPEARPMHPDWARQLRDQCQRADVPFFFKQWGTYLPIPVLDANGHGKMLDDDVVALRVGKRAAGRELDGRIWNEYPAPGGPR